MQKVFVDTNIILDWLGKRIPFHAAAKDLFLKGESKEVEILVSTMSFISTEYILRKQLGIEKLDWLCLQLKISLQFAIVAKKLL